jgi:type I restriction enzyme, S subunit
VRGWQEIPLQDALDALIDYRGKSPTKSEKGIPVISAKVVKDGRILDNIEQTIDPEYYAEWMRRGRPKVGDVVLTTEGPLGEVARLDEASVNYALGQRIVTLRGRSGFLDNGFLKYLLISAPIQERLQSRATGSTVSGISQKSLREMNIPIAPLPEQREIAGILGALDDKIELNRRMAATLEEMARSLYRSWFVNFDPVHAKAAGLPPAHMDAATAALFPDRFGDDGLPEGWRVGTVGDLFSLQRGFDLPKDQRTTGPFPVVAAGGIHGYHSDYKVKAPGVTTGRSGVIGEVFMVLEDFWPLNTSLWVKEFKAASPFFVYFFLQHIDLKSLNSGSAVPSLNRNNVENLPTHIPPKPVISCFQSLASAMFESQHTLSKQNQTLAALRDSLLPRLMSGDLRVGAARAQVEEVV